MLYICNELNISKNNMCEEVVEVKQNIEEEIDYKNLYIRLLADHDNYVKRTRETISNTTRQSQSNTMIETVLPIYNDLYCAVIQNIEGSVLLLNKLNCWNTIPICSRWMLMSTLWSARSTPLK